MEFITRAERERIEQRLAELRANRVVLSKRIGEARAQGDLSENADYHAAREQQGLEEAEIRRLEERLARAQVIEDGAGNMGVVFLGSIVRLREVDAGQEEVVRLVGEPSYHGESEYDEVTVGSPMGEALLKARVGDVVRVRTPRGVRRYEVLEIR